MPGLLSDEHMDQLEDWIGTGPKQFNLLYAITRDGCGPAAFLKACKDRGPTMTVLYNIHGSVFGGYTSLAWQSDNKYKSDDQAFLFQLAYSYKKLSRKFPSNKTDNTVYHGPAHGPLFGSGHDLLTFYNANVAPVNTVYSLNKASGQMNPSASFVYDGVTAADINNGTMDVVEVEVYGVADGMRTSKMRLWRNYPELNLKYLDKLREEIITMRPPNPESVPEFRILLTGPVAVGKSSFINTISSVMSGRIRQLAMTGTHSGGITTKYTSYTIRGSSGKNLALRLCDTPGHGMSITDTCFLVDGHVPDQYQFSDRTIFSLKTSGARRNPGLKDEIHCVVLVVDAEQVKNIHDETKKRLLDVKGMCVTKGIPQAIILTKVDKVVQCGNDWTNIFKNKNIESLVEKVSNMFGVPENNVMPVKNYAKEAEPETDVDILALLALRRLQHLSMDHLETITSGEVEAGSVPDESLMSDTA